MDDRWTQVNIAYPGRSTRERERHAVAHLDQILPSAEAAGLITAWWFIRKGRWRIRYRLADQTREQNADPLHPLLIHGVTWTRDIYEPEIHAFGGSASMRAAHTLFHHDSAHLLTYLATNPADRRERSLVLCTALMRAAGLDWAEQGDVWARIAEQRAGLRTEPRDPQAHPGSWAAFTCGVQHLLRGAARPDRIGTEWLAAFENAGRALRTLREDGDLTRGVRAVITQHVIFHWNRIGLRATAQATLAQAAKEAVFGSPPRQRMNAGSHRPANPS
ncbi:thiopeptide-type bacteriocin biosynthesis protein [Actinomadura rayongensis]|uniref:thiopeptide-type bacteriocin biosynthesis protein n=1 Tax=Actinomadura rayongensis TaxID=1429076 RepID=UPI00301BEE95